MPIEVLDVPKTVDEVEVNSNEPLFFDLSREVVCDLMSHLVDAPYPAEKTRVRFDPAKPDQLNYLSFSIGQAEGDRQWDGVIPISGCNREYVQSFIDTAIQQRNLGLNP